MFNAGYRYNNTNLNENNINISPSPTYPFNSNYPNYFNPSLSQGQTFPNNLNNNFLPPIPITKEMILPKEEINMVSIVKKLKEDRIVEVMNKQMQILEDLQYRISNKADDEQKKMKDVVEKMEKEREAFLKQQRYDELIKEKVEKSKKIIFF